MLVLRRPTDPVGPPGGPGQAPGPVLDDAQAAAVCASGRVVRVLGGPGTGKSLVAVETVLRRVRSGQVEPARCLLVAPTRVAAATLRDALTAAVAGTTTQPMARTLASFAFGLLRQDAALRGDPPPRLLSGPEQDVILRDLLAGHAAGDGVDPGWPESVRPALATRGFRAELRDLLMRAVEHGLDPPALADLGRRHERPEWVAGAAVLEEYDRVSALSAPGAYDPAWLLTVAADLLEDDDEARARVHDEVRLVVVDDAQELTPAGARLVTALAGPHTAVVLVGDPDAAVQTFRGGDPRWLAGGWVALGDGPTHVLDRSHRLPRAVAAAAGRVAAHIGSAGTVAQRRAEPRDEDGVVEAHLLRSAAQEGAFIASRFRRAHLLTGVPWSQMAVVVRGQGRTATLRRVLAAAGVPVSAPTTDIPVRDEVAVRPLLALLGQVLAVADGSAEVLDHEVVVDALLSPLGDADAVLLRRLRRSLRHTELGGGGSRPSDDLLADAVLHPAVLLELGPEAAPARRLAKVVAAGLAAARTGDGGWAPGVTAESVLWAMWAAAGVAGQWRATALAGGAAGARRDRDLDAVLALFDAAARFTDRLPQAGPDAFLDHVLGQDVPGDTLVARAPAGESVTLVTPAAAAGRQWRLVVVAGVQEGVWPDLRLRGSLLGSSRLVDVVLGRPDSWRAAQAAVRHDETRLFHVAVTRASEQLLVTAVRSDDEQPSAYLDVVDPRDPEAPTGRAVTEVDRPMTLPGLVAQLRRDLLDPEPRARGTAVTALARLARAGVPGADPSRWWVLSTVSDDRDLRDAAAPVTVSPSRVEGFGTCQLRWLLTTRGGDGPSIGSADLGTLVHEVAAAHGDDADAATLRAHLDREWPRLGMRPGWVERQRHGEAHAMVDRLATYFARAASTGWTRVGAEVAMEVRLGRAVLRGRVDRIERSEQTGELRVVDYKTGSSKPRAADLPRHAQLGCYQVAVEHGAFGELGEVSGGAGLLQLGRAATKETKVDLQPPLATDAEPDWAQDLVVATAEGMAGRTFSATVGTHCGTCPVQTSCPAQADGKGRWL